MGAGGANGRMAGRRDWRYIRSMGKTTDAIRAVVPAATPDPADIEAWNALPRDVQVARFREALSDPDCARATDATMQDVLRDAKALLQGDGG